MAINHTSALTTVVSYPDRGTGGSSRYRGNCSPRLIEDLIAHFGIQEVCDYMCGSNTTGDAAASMGITSHTYDLHSGFDLLHCDIPERPQFIFWHPPYWDIIKYSDVMYRAADVRERYGYLLLRKDAPLQYPLLMTCSMEGDIRDMPGATWRDILADAMESFQDAVRLEKIYSQVGHYQRAKKQQYWQENDTVVIISRKGHYERFALVRRKEAYRTQNQCFTLVLRFFSLLSFVCLSIIETGKKSPLKSIPEGSVADERQFSVSG